MTAPHEAVLYGGALAVEGVGTVAAETTENGVAPSAPAPRPDLSDAWERVTAALGGAAITAKMLDRALPEYVAVHRASLAVIVAARMAEVHAADYRVPAGLCGERAGYGWHRCHLPQGHDGDCECECGEAYGDPF